MMLTKWFKFISGILIILFFVFFIAPAIKNSSMLQHHYCDIEKQGIDAGALFYTESEEALSAIYRINK